MLLVLLEGFNWVRGRGGGDLEILNLNRVAAL